MVSSSIARREVGGGPSSSSSSPWLSNPTMLMLPQGVLEEKHLQPSTSVTAEGD